MQSRSTVPIDGTNIEAAREYIRQQFAQRSWWPTEGPFQAQADFAAMQDTPPGLMAWCDKWLNAAQRQALDKAIRRASPHAA